MDYLGKISIIAILILSLVVIGCGNGSDNDIASSNSGNVLTDPHTKLSFDFSQALCARCHTHEGAKAYIGVVNGLESPDEIYALLKNENDIADPSPVQCQTCHDLDNTGSFLGDQITGLPATWSSQFKTCTACHQLVKYDELVNMAFHETWGDVWCEERVITDTHYDDPLTTDIEGYVVNTSSTHSSESGNMNDGTCVDCHYPHDIDLTVNRQWANSAHGGHIGEDGLVEEADGPAWVHYNFKGSDRQSCQQCHTATGFRNFANNPATYDPANNFFTASGEQREMLYCWACHINNVGGLRDPGLFNATASYPEPVDRINAVPDINGSNICMPCHSGRESGTDAIANSSDDFSNKSFVNSHYLAAGGILFRTAGYEYALGNYAGHDHFAHDQIGTASEPETGDNGPCVGCHLRSKEVGHTLEVVHKDDMGAITEIPANGDICSNCHQLAPFGDYRLTPEKLNHEMEGFENALHALETALNNSGIYFYPSHPYFYTAPFNPDYQETGNCSENLAVKNWQTGGTSIFTYNISRDRCDSSVDNAGTPGTGKNNMGAAFNFNLLHHEPGAYAHNRVYAKKLIFDSIDWLDNSVIDGTIDLSAFPGAAEWYQADDGDTSDDNSVTRPE